MAFDKESYWKEKTARKIAGKAAAAVISTRLVCRRCEGSAGQLVNGAFFCANDCDQNPLWDRIVGYLGLGNWRVIYRGDGQISIPMTRRVAEFCMKRAGGGRLIRTKAPVTFAARLVPCKLCKLSSKHLIGPEGELL